LAFLGGAPAMVMVARGGRTKLGESDSSVCILVYFQILLNGKVVKFTHFGLLQDSYSLTYFKVDFIRLAAKIGVRETPSGCI
jgi:hypothetical protein